MATSGVVIATTLVKDMLDKGRQMGSPSACRSRRTCTNIACSLLVHHLLRSSYVDPPVH